MAAHDKVMYIFVNHSVKMSPAKMAAQVGHAAVKAYLLSDQEEAKLWDEHSYTKIILSANSKEHLITIKNQLDLQGIKSFLVVDEGRTEIEPGQVTALGVAIVDKIIQGHLFKSYQLYK